MTDSFNLVTEPWLLVTDLETGQPTEVNLDEALTQAHRVRLAADGYLQEAVLLRLLLAVFDAAAGPIDTADWVTAWRAETLDADRIGDYLETWAHRFDLLDPDAPAFQHSAIAAPTRPADTLLPTQLGGSATAWFLGPHGKKGPIGLAASARYLLERLACDVSGIKAKPGGGRTYGAHPGPLHQAVHAHLVGRTLKDMLLLNLPPQPRAEGDAPVWERPEAPVLPGRARPITGRLDWLTWPARTLRLFAEDGTITGLAWHDGDRPDAYPRGLDPTTAWRHLDDTTRRLSLPAQPQRIPAHFPAAILLDDTIPNHRAWSPVVDHLIAHSAYLDPKAPIGIVLCLPHLNSHATTITGIDTASVRLASGADLADPVRRRLLGAAAWHRAATASALANALNRVWRSFLRDDSAHYPQLEASLADYWSATEHDFTAIFDGDGPAGEHDPKMTNAFIRTGLGIYDMAFQSHTSRMSHILLIEQHRDPIMRGWRSEQ